MPETRSKTLASPSQGQDNVNFDGLLTNQRLVRRPPVREMGVRERVQGRRDATDFTTNQRVKLKDGDLRMARMQISIKKLGMEINESKKELQELCKLARVDVDQLR